jgi:hypothetical protein
MSSGDSKTTHWIGEKKGTIDDFRSSKQFLDRAKRSIIVNSTWETEHQAKKSMKLELVQLKFIT